MNQPRKYNYLLRTDQYDYPLFAKDIDDAIASTKTLHARGCYVQIERWKDGDTAHTVIYAPAERTNA